MSTELEWPVLRVRQQFVDFFKTKEHTFYPSSPVVPLDDPTLLFINAGMNQFKSLFLGTADPNTEFGQLTRAANSQLCIRAGGKHNDLDDVGRDTYHHTFFEMLGSWSFGGYFKKEAITWAFELLTQVYGLPVDRLYATYFEGDPANGLEADIEAKNLWAQFLPEDHIIPGNAKDNFWEMGDTGPCGPCSEVHFDRVGGRNAADLVNKDDPLVIEIWNLVFMQFERKEGGSLVPLPNKHVDTGMGLERLVSILQKVQSNYDTDIWTGIFDAIQKVTGYPKSYIEIKDEPTNDAVVAYRVVADHIRCLTTALADGAVPDSVGRGFVLRRIIRRAIRYGVQFLDAKTGFFSELVDPVCASLGPFFPHLQDPKVIQRVKAILLDEEHSFAKTWETGLKHFNKAMEEAKESNSTTVSAVNAFILHDRYGFPVDLTILLAEKAGMTVDIEGFQAEMKATQTNGGRVAAAKTFIDVHQIEELKKKNAQVTKDSSKYTWADSTAEIVAIYNKKEESFVDVLKPSNDFGEEGVALILDQTNFYAESGGQLYDIGRIVAAEDCVFEVKKVYAVGGYVVHIGNLSKTSTAPVPTSASVQLQVNYERRKDIAANHTSTHELNWVLRRVLEDEKPDSFMEVNQKGSLVTEEILRFDFSYNAKLTNEEIAQVESLLNAKINENLQVFRKEVPLAVATKIAGLRQMFGEKYPDPVSVISIGAPIDEILECPEDDKWRKYSIEFCGGTHLPNLAEAERAIILSEEALMKGVRRIVVATRSEAGKAAATGATLNMSYDEILKLGATAATVKELSVLNKKVGDSTAPLLVKHLLRERIDSSIKEINAQLKVKASESKEQAEQKGKSMGAELPSDQPLFALVLNDFGADREALQAFADSVIGSASHPVGVLVFGCGGDSCLAVSKLSDDLVAKKLSAVAWIKASVGKGGGKPNSAQSGLPAESVNDALAKALAEAEEMKKKL